MFDPLLDLYEPRFDCIRYDNRGSGRSDPHCARPRCRSSRTTSAHVYGVSMGGMIAQELAIRHPERVRGLVFGATRPAARGQSGRRSASRRPWALLPRTRSRSPAGRGWGEAVLPRVPPRSAGARAWLLRHFAAHRARPQGIAAHWWASVYHDTLSRLGQIQAPTLVMQGERDAMSPMANARMLADRIPDAELAVVAGAGHAYALERPQESLERMVRWLGSREPIPAGAPRTGAAARAEPVTRVLGLPIGALRRGASLLALGADKINQGRRDVAADRRAA